MQSKWRIRVEFAEESIFLGLISHGRKKHNYQVEAIISLQTSRGETLMERHVSVKKGTTKSTITLIGSAAASLPRVFTVCCDDKVNEAARSDVEAQGEYESLLLATALEIVPKEVTLKSEVDDEEIEAHKFMLVAVSRYFRDMFATQSVEASSNEVTLAFSGAVISQVIDIIYDNYFPVLPLIDYLPIIEMLDYIRAEDFLRQLLEKVKRAVTEDVAIDLCIAAHEMPAAAEIKTVAIEVIGEHFEALKHGDKWKKDLCRHADLIEEVWAARTSPNIIVVSVLSERQSGSTVRRP